MTGLIGSYSFLPSAESREFIGRDRPPRRVACREVDFKGQNLRVTQVVLKSQVLVVLIPPQEVSKWVQAYQKWNRSIYCRPLHVQSIGNLQQESILNRRNEATVK
ncbi:hypothetical protein PGT21_001337 [Puccinia graminis f. sp. tritici]|uniref:Uncharacterized protein n=1 Tax=Puccinia graminis f. sp. tritici TaxID=56615 RepID=A0A5B0QVD0_PUCGR|nr:hypothetical protein PGT21_001337 [Puccinia graminis f. sp. tritici]